MTEERVFLNEGGMTVSAARVILGGTTYSTANITSVSKRVNPAKTGCAVALIIFGVICVLSAFAGFGESASAGLGGLVVAGLILAGGILWHRSLKPDFIVVFASASGESKALTSKDEALIDRVVAAVNEAIVARG